VLQAENEFLKERLEYMAGQAHLEHSEMTSLRAQIQVGERVRLQCNASDGGPFLVPMREPLHARICTYRY